MQQTLSFIIRVVCLLGILSLVGVALAQAQEDNTRTVNKTGTSAADFLSIPVGARATAMGSAISASVDDGTAIYWNPAGLANLQKGAFTAEYAEWLVDIQFNYAALAFPTSFGTVGIGVTALRTPEMDVTTEANQNGTGETFRSASYAFSLSYARNLTDRFQLGATVKLINESILNSSANGVAIDIGTVFTTPFRGIRLGASISNFGTKMQIGGEDLLVPVDIAPGQSGNNESTRGEIITDAFDLPLTMRIGLAGEIFETASTRVTLAVDALNPNNNGQYVNVGGEVAMLGGLLMLRGGYNELFLDDSVRSFTLGGGLHYAFGPLDVQVDYAYEAQEFFNATNRFTLALKF